MVDSSHVLFESLPESWQHELADLHANFSEIETLLIPGQYNPEGKVFAALTVEPRDVAVVIIGQDPYPNSEHAIGLAFAVPPGTSKLPPSLKNILKEVESDLGRPTSLNQIVQWPSQGVLMLNTHLTCEKGVPLSHQKFGWQNITTRIIEVVAKNDPVAILWGAHAEKFTDYFASERVISSPHPSPLSSYRGFFGSKPFSRANDILRSQARKPIDW